MASEARTGRARDGAEPPSGPRLVVATTNPNKLREIRGILDGTGVIVDGLDAFPPVATGLESYEPSVARTAKTFS